MKRHDLVKHLVKEGCIFLREGARHSVFFNPSTKRVSTVPRHKEIHNFLARKICRDLGVEEIKK
ncbi:MAG: type II toxin-antitoxin system HicA family toxin [Parcubacteria group bacterium]|nr:type II toxin-antitoxin system HicA family toxin [Parcubacteria group bacterium]